MLAPLAGVSDHPFRRLCVRAGAHLSYVEMLSATALLFESPRTYQMMRRHPDETRLGVQLTGKTPDEVARGVAVLDRLGFDTIDINMGCPVAKVVRAGCGSAILRDPSRVYETVRLAAQATGKPLSVKIRAGWDRHSVTALEVADAAEKGGAAWITVHGRLRSDDYAAPVDLGLIAAIKKRLTIPVIGNGNILTAQDARTWLERTGCDGLMIGRGAVGHPSVFREIREGRERAAAEDVETVLLHTEWMEAFYGQKGVGPMRGHLMYYSKGLDEAKRFRRELVSAETFGQLRAIIARYFVKTAECAA